MIIHFKESTFRKDVYVPDNASIRDLIGIIGVGNFWGHRVCIDGTDIDTYTALACREYELLDRLVFDFAKQKDECTVVATYSCSGWCP